MRVLRHAAEGHFDSPRQPHPPSSRCSPPTKTIEAFALDQVAPSFQKTSVGNLTDFDRSKLTGNSCRSWRWRLRLNPHFEALIDLLPDVPWVYYNSGSGFNIYLWVSSDSYFYKRTCGRRGVPI